MFVSRVRIVLRNRAIGRDVEECFVLGYMDDTEFQFIRESTLLALEAIGANGAADVLRKVVEDAKGGDMRAAEILLCRLWPERKGRPIARDLPPLVTPALEGMPACVWLHPSRSSARAAGIGAVAACLA